MMCTKMLIILLFEINCGFIPVSAQFRFTPIRGWSPVLSEFIAPAVQVSRQQGAVSRPAPNTINSHNDVPVAIMASFDDRFSLGVKPVRMPARMPSAAQQMTGPVSASRHTESAHLPLVVLRKPSTGSSTSRMRIPLRRPVSGQSSSEQLPYTVSVVPQRQPLVLARSRLNTVPLFGNNNNNNNNNNSSRGPLGKTPITSSTTSNNVLISQNNNQPNNLNNQLNNNFNNQPNNNLNDQPNNNLQIATSSVVNKLFPDVMNLASSSAGAQNTNAVLEASTVNTAPGIPSASVANASTDPFFHNLVHELVNILDPASSSHSNTGHAVVHTQGMASWLHGHTVEHHHAVPSQSAFGTAQMLVPNAVPISNFHPQMGLAHAHAGLMPGMFGGPLGVNPWLMDPSFRQEMLFGDTTDPPEPVQTTTAAPKLVTTTPTTLTVLPVAITTTEAMVVESTKTSKKTSKLIVEQPLNTKPELQNMQTLVKPDKVKLEVANTQIIKQSPDTPETVKLEVAKTHFNKEIPIKIDSLKVEVANTQVNTKMVTEITGMLSNSQLDKATVVAAIKLVARQLGELPAELQTIAGELGITLEHVTVTTPTTRQETMPSIEQLGIVAGAATGNVSRRDIVEQLKGATRGVVVYPPTTQATRQAVNPDEPTQPLLLVETIAMGSKPENKTHMTLQKPVPVAAAQTQSYPAQPEVYQTLRTILDHNPKALFKVIDEAPTVPGTPLNKPEVSVQSLVDKPGAGMQGFSVILNNISKHATGSQPTETHIYLSPYTTVSSVSSEVIKSTPISVIEAIPAIELPVPAPTVLIPKLANFEGVPVRIADISVSNTASTDPGVETILNEISRTNASSFGKHEALISEKLSNPEFVAALKRVLTRMLAENATLSSVASRPDVMTTMTTLETTSSPLITTTEEIELEDILTATPTYMPTTPEP